MSVYELIFNLHRLKVGGAMRDRTADLLRARQALSQLSYNPMFLRELTCVNQGILGRRLAR